MLGHTPKGNLIDESHMVLFDEPFRHSSKESFEEHEGMKSGVSSVNMLSDNLDSLSSDSDEGGAN